MEYGEEYSDEPEPETDIERDAVSVFINDERLKFDVPPAIINDRTMVPMRAIFSALGATVTWDEKTKTATGVLGKSDVKITIGNDYLLKNNEKISLDSPAIIISDRTLVPIRAIAESLDCKVEWYSETQTVEILK